LSSTNPYTSIAKDPSFWLIVRQNAKDEIDRAFAQYVYLADIGHQLAAVVLRHAG
jgi:hypothetical protein